MKGEFGWLLSVIGITFLIYLALEGTFAICHNLWLVFVILAVIFIMYFNAVLTKVIAEFWENGKMNKGLSLWTLDGPKFTETKQLTLYELRFQISLLFFMR